jgi:hypothetical protein
MAQGARRVTVRNLLAWAATLGMAALALRVPWSLLMETNPRAWIYLKGDPRVGRVVQEMEPLKPYLPKYGTVGFASTLTREEYLAQAWDPRRHSTERDAYVMMRYALAPLMVRWSADEKLVVASFPDVARLKEFAAEHGLKTLVPPAAGNSPVSAPGIDRRDAGPTVAVLEREEP